MTLGKKNFTLYCSIKAFCEIGKRCGGIDNLSEWLTAGKYEDTLSKFAIVIAELVNGGLAYEEYETGDKSNRVTADQIMTMMRPGDVANYKAEIFDAMRAGSQFDSGDDEVVDEDLEEIQAEKNG